MRIFEIIFLTLLVFSCLNSVTFRNKKAGFYLPASAVFICLFGILTEGMRTQIIPGLILSGVLMILSLLRLLLPAHSKKSAKSAGSTAKLAFGILTKSIKIIAATLLLAVSVALPLLFPVAKLPEGSGPYPVGTMFLSFSDSSHLEYLSEAVEKRNIPVQVWYPASGTAGKKPVSWICSKKAIGLFAKYRRLPELFDQLTLVKTHSYLDTGLSEREEKYPVILFSGGGAMFNGQNVIQMEELASHGYVIFAVGHPEFDFACTYPDGTVEPYNTKLAALLSTDTEDALKTARKKFKDENDPEFSRAILRNAVLSNKSVRIWSHEMGFVANRIVEMSSEKSSGESTGESIDIFSGRLDAARMGAFGHSFGGAASGQLCLENDRVKAFINLDGSPFGDAPDKKIQQPFMIMTHGGDQKYSIRNGYSAKEDNYLVVQVKGAKHMNFTDINTLIPALGRLSGFLGNIGTDRQTEITNSYILGFFDHYLKGKPDLLLKNPAPKYSEVTVSVY